MPEARPEIRRPAPAREAVPLVFRSPEEVYQTRLELGGNTFPPVPTSPPGPNLRARPSPCAS